MMKKDREVATRKIICILSIFIYFFGSYGNTAFAQISLPSSSSLQRKFTSASDLLNYSIGLSASDQVQFLNSSTTVCDQQGDKIFSEGNTSVYKFLCFVNNDQNANLQLTLNILNVGKNDFTFVGYTSSNDSAMAFDGYGSLKFTVFSNSRVVFSALLSSSNTPGIDPDTNQGKIIVLHDSNEFSTFLNTVHTTESLAFLQDAFQNLFGVPANAQYSTSNVQTSDSSASAVLSSLTSDEIFSLMSGQTLQKSSGSSTYSVSLDAQSAQVLNIPTIPQLNPQ